MNVSFLKKQRKASTIISVIAFFAVFFIFCGFAIDFSMIVTTRNQLQTAVETTALSSASEINSTEAEKTARKIFSYSKTNSLKNSQITNIAIKKDSNAILIEASVPAQTYFLSALGIKTVEIQARSAAMIDSIKLTPDTNFNIENHLQFTAPALIFSKNGTEIKIVRSDNTTEYLVYVGLDDKINETKWVEISCSSNDITAKEQYFNLDDKCLEDQYNGGISAAKYIRIINNNSTTPLEIDKLALNNVIKLIKYSKFKSL